MAAFGEFIGRDQIAQAFVDVIATPPPKSSAPLLVYYLADIERQRGLVPRTITIPGTYRTGLDFEQWITDSTPAVIVVAQPRGDAELYDEGVYGQWYDIQAGAVCFDPNGDEVVAAQEADYYGLALANLIQQHRALGSPPGFAVSQTQLRSAPQTAFIPGAQRSLCVGMVTVRTRVEQDIVESTPPLVIPPDPYTDPAAWPTVLTVNSVTVTAEPIT